MRLLTAPPPWLVVVNVMLGTVTVSLNNTALNPALPTFIEVFDLGPVLATWILASFMASMGITLPLTSYLSQILGRKRLYLGGLALFVAGSLIGTLATGIEMVLAARVIQGIAGGLMIPLSPAIIFAVFAKEDRGRATGLWGAAVMLAPAVGPLCGALVLEWYDWRALFLLNVPVALSAFLLGIRVLPKSEPNARKPFDLPGYLLIAFGIGLLLFVTSRLHRLEALLDPLNLLLLPAALLCLAAFVRRVLRHPHPLLDLRLFTLRGYRNSVIIAVVQAVGMFQTLLLIPLLIQLVMGHSAIWTGLALLCTAVCGGLFGQLGGRALDRRGAREAVSSGVLLTGTATLGLGLLGTNAPLWTVFALMMLRGAGLGLSYMPVTTAGLNSLPEAMVTQGAAMNNISRRLGASLALVLASLWLEFQLAANGAETTAYASAIGDILIATGVLVLLALPWAWRFPTEETEPVNRPLAELPVRN